MRREAKKKRGGRGKKGEGVRKPADEGRVGGISWAKDAEIKDRKVLLGMGGSWREREKRGGGK